MKQDSLSHWDTGSIIRLLAVLGSVGLYLSVTQWAEHLEFTFVLILVGVLVGGILATSRFSFWECTGAAFILGTLTIFYFLGSTFPKHTGFLDRQFDLVLILNQSISELVNRQPVSSSLLFLAAVMNTCWYLGFFGGLSLIRNAQPWIPVALGGLGIIIIDLFLPASRRNGLFSALFFLFLLFLLSRIFFTHVKKKWQKEKIHFDTDAHFDLNRLVILNVLIIILFAWTIPVAVKAFTPGTVEQLKFHAYMEKLTQQWNNAFAPLNQTDDQTIYSYDDLLSIGNSTPSSEKTIFSVQTDTVPPAGIHYYWRARSYDSYDGSNWFNSETSNLTYSAGNELTPMPNGGDPELVQFSFLTNARIGIFFQGGIPGAVDQPGQEIFNPAGDNQRDVIAVIPDKTIEQGALYTVEGWITAPTISEMKGSSSNYPAWVLYRYLSIPISVPDRVRKLAETITADASDPYTKVEEITMYLRLNMHYANGIPALPKGRDLVDWFLFDSKKGFCTQYASAEVILLRSLGIPARLVVGYAQGAVSQSGKLYNVRLRDSHAWPEVYFVDLGWVVFEPTVIISQQLFLEGISTTEQVTPTPQPTHIIPVPSEAGATTENVTGPIQVTSSTLSKSSLWVLWIVFSIIFILIVGLIYLFINRQQKKGSGSFPAFINKMIRSRGGTTPKWVLDWERELHYQTIERYFRVIQQGLKATHEPIRKSDTPQEQVRRFIKAIPSSSGAAQKLLLEYEKSIYAGQKPNLKESIKNVRKIRKMILQEQIRRLFHKA